VAAEFKDAFGVESNLVPGHDGIFDVVVDDKLVFSNSQIGRFPEPGEVVAKLKHENTVQVYLRKEIVP